MENMKPAEAAEFWLSGPLAGVPALLQPVAHTLLQVQREVNDLVSEIPADRLWDRPAGLASPGFHLQHMAGVVDRLFTYASGSALNEEQLHELSAEGLDNGSTAAALAELLHERITAAVRHLARLGADTPALTQTCFVGRKKIPSTRIGLLFHAAEHLMRHTGQLLVTVRVLARS